MILLPSGEIGVEGVELAGPEDLVVREPRRRAPHHARVEPTLGHAARARTRDESGTLEHAEVLGDGGQ
jgi:hypothetical protein